MAAGEISIGDHEGFSDVGALSFRTKDYRIEYFDYIKTKSYACNC